MLRKFGKKYQTSFLQKYMITAKTLLSAGEIFSVLLQRTLIVYYYP